MTVYQCRCIEPRLHCTKRPEKSGKAHDARPTCAHSTYDGALLSFHVAHDALQSSESPPWRLARRTRHDKLLRDRPVRKRGEGETLESLRLGQIACHTVSKQQATPRNRATPRNGPPRGTLLEPSPAALGASAAASAVDASESAAATSTAAPLAAASLAAASVAAADAASLALPARRGTPL
jgi:hypothetical protein